jgi:mediator of RNA polymerase II transcription subunit 18
MHELFLTTHLADGDVSKATCILQGYCEMPPVPILNRRLIFDVPRAIKFKGIDPVFVSKQPPHKTHLWRALHEQLIRNLFIVTLLYPVTKDQFGTEESTEENISYPFSRCFYLTKLLIYR